MPTIYYTKPDIASSGTADFSGCVFKQIQNIVIAASIRIELNDCIFTPCASYSDILVSSYQVTISSSCFFNCFSDACLITYRNSRGFFSINNSDFFCCSSNNVMFSAIYGSQTLEEYNVSNCICKGNMIRFDEQESAAYNWINLESCRIATVAFFDNPPDGTKYEIRYLNVIDNSADKNDFLMKLNGVSAIRNAVFQRNRYEKAFNIYDDKIYFYNVIMDEEKYSNNKVAMTLGSKFNITSPLKFDNPENKCFLNLRTNIANNEISCRNSRNVINLVCFFAILVKNFE